MNSKNNKIKGGSAFTNENPLIINDIEQKIVKYLDYIETNSINLEDMIKNSEDLEFLNNLKIIITSLNYLNNHQIKGGIAENPLITLTKNNILTFHSRKVIDNPENMLIYIQNQLYKQNY